MAIPSFYYPDLTREDTLIELAANEASHAVKSLRLGVGNDVRLLNGHGLVGHGQLAELENRCVKVQLSDVVEHARESRVAIATAIPKGDRQKVMVDMLTQLGVGEIIPLTCEHSVTRFKANTHDKWQRVAIEACKQSQNPWLPEIDEAISVIDIVKVAAERLVFADSEGEPLANIVLSSNSAIGNVGVTGDSLIVMIGPEGGFSPAERALFYDNGIKSVTLGKHILRTETAAVTAAAQCQ